MRTRIGVLSATIAVVLSAGALSAVAEQPSGGPPSQVPRAECGPGSLPETGLQGQVSREDRDSGRSQQGYRCNLELLGQYQGEGASFVHPSYGHCSYMATSFYGLGPVLKKSQGVQVIDVSSPAAPRLSTNLTSPAMQIPWETLKVHDGRGLLAAAAGNSLAGFPLFDIYDIKGDCANPVLLNGIANTNLTVPATLLGHEGEFSPDGMTYWSSGVVGGALTATDISDPSHPRIVFTGLTGVAHHGFSLSPDGNTMYLSTLAPAGFVTLDVSDIQARKRLPMIREISRVSWNLTGIGQHTIPVTYDGVPHVIAVDEFGRGSVRIYDVSNPRAPKFVRHMQLEAQQDRNLEINYRDNMGSTSYFYETHYCAVDRRVDPTRLGCGADQSGVRIFDIVDPRKPREIAYYNPPAQVDKRFQLPGSDHTLGIPGGVVGVPFFDLDAPLQDPKGLTTSALQNGVVADLTVDLCTSPPKFVGPDQLWVTCADNGFQVLKFTNDVHSGG